MSGKDYIDLMIMLDKDETLKHACIETAKKQLLKDGREISESNIYKMLEYKLHEVENIEHAFGILFIWACQLNDI